MVPSNIVSRFDYNIFQHSFVFQIGHVLIRKNWHKFKGPSALPPSNFNLHLVQLELPAMFSKRALCVATVVLVVTLLVASYPNCKIFPTPRNERNFFGSTSEAPLIYGGDPQRIPG